MNTKQYEARKNRLKSILNVEAPPILVAAFCESVLLTYHGGIWRFMWYYFKFQISVWWRAKLTILGIIKTEERMTANGDRDKNKIQ